MSRCKALALIGAFTLFDNAKATCTLDRIDECIRDDPAAAAEIIDREVPNTRDVNLILKAAGLFRDAPDPIRDYRRAARYFARAASLGEPWASFMLAKMMIDGKAVGS